MNINIRPRFRRRELTMTEIMAPRPESEDNRWFEELKKFSDLLIRDPKKAMEQLRPKSGSR